METVTKVRHSKAEWRVVVDDMVARGAEGKAEQLDLAVEYLARNFGTGTDSWITYSGALVFGLITFGVVRSLQTRRPSEPK